MYDRPNLYELVDAVRMHLEQNLVPAAKADPRLYFQTLVAVNVMRIIGRELQLGEAHANAEWQSLNQLEAVDMPAPARYTELQAALAERNVRLSATIRQGVYDSLHDALLPHLKSVVAAQLEVANPRYLQNVMQEDDAARD